VNDDNNVNELDLEQDKNNVNDSQENIYLDLEQNNNSNGNDSQENQTWNCNQITKSKKRK
jgi:hypothetical protein